MRNLNPEELCHVYGGTSRGKRKPAKKGRARSKSNSKSRSISRSRGSRSSS